MSQMAPPMRHKAIGSMSKRLLGVIVVIYCLKLMALDFIFLLGNLISILILLALYGALHQVNESYALIALVLGLKEIIINVATLGFFFQP